MAELTDKEKRMLVRNIQALVDRQDDFIDDTVEGLSREYGAAIDSLGLSALRALRTDDEGRIIADTKTIRRILPAERVRLLASTDVFKDIWNAWDKRLGRLQDNIQDHFEASEGALLSDAEAAKRSEWTQNDLAAIRELRGQWPTPGDEGSGLAGRFFSLSDTDRRALADTITRGVMGRQREKDLVKQLARVTDKTTKRAKFLFDQSTMEFSRAVHDRKAADLGYEHFQYFGPLDRVTRPFCRRLLGGSPVGKIFTREQIDAMDNGQTGAGSVFVSGGGFRCRHHWRAVRPEWFAADEFAELTTGDVPQTATQPDGDEPSGDQVDEPADQPAPQAGAVIETEPDDQRSTGDRRREALADEWRSPVRLPQLSEAGLAEFGQRGQSFTDEPLEFDAGELAQDKADLRRMYQATQARLIESGESSITVFRTVDPDQPFEVEGVLVEWTTERPTAGEFIEERVDARRVAFDSRTPGWTGAPAGVALLRERPNLVFESDDFDLPGGVKSSEVDAGAERAGTWGIILEPGRENRPSRGQLIHIPSGEAVISGQFTRADLRTAARDLDRFTDPDGRLPTAGALRGAFEEERELSIRFGQTGRVGIAGTVQRLETDARGRESLMLTKVGITAEEFLDVGGLEFPIINTGAIRKKAITAAKAKDKSGKAIDRWGRAGSKNTTARVLVERESGRFEVVEIKGHVRGNFFIYTTDNAHNATTGYAVQDWHLVHLATGIELKSGTSLFIEGGGGIPSLGGWRLFEMQEAARELEAFLDPDTGAVLAGQQEDWLQTLARLERETAPGEDVADVLGDRFLDEDWTLNPITRRLRPQYDALRIDEGDRFLDDWNASDVDIDDLQRDIDARDGTIEASDDLSDIPF